MRNRKKSFKSANTKNNYSSSSTEIRYVSLDKVILNHLSFVVLNSKFIGIFANSVDLWRDIAFFLTILINTFILISFYSGTYTTSSEAEHNRLWNPELGVDGSVTVEKTKSIF